MTIHNMAPIDSKRMSIVAHFEELRTRLLRALVFVGIGMGIGIVFSKPLYRCLSFPMRQVLPSGDSFIVTSPIEAFMTYIKTGFVAGLFVAVPFIFYELWCFIAPGLHAVERKRSIVFVLLTSLCFMGGAVFGYFVVFPSSFSFFSGLLEGTAIRFLPRMSEYLSFAVHLLLAFGIVFELPVLLVVLGRLGIVSAEQLGRIRPYTIVGIFIVAGLLTGPDVVSQLLMAAPLLVLYELSVLLVRILGKQGDRAAQQAAPPV